MGRVMMSLLALETAGEGRNASPIGAVRNVWCHAAVSHWHKPQFTVHIIVLDKTNFFKLCSQKETKRDVTKVTKIIFCR